MGAARLINERTARGRAAGWRVWLRAASVTASGAGGERQSATRSSMICSRLWWYPWLRPAGVLVCIELVVLIYFSKGALADWPSIGLFLFLLLIAALIFSTRASGSLVRGAKGLLIGVNFAIAPFVRFGSASAVSSGFEGKRWQCTKAAQWE